MYPRDNASVSAVGQLSPEEVEEGILTLPKGSHGPEPLGQESLAQLS
jgi:hypothetical protein